MQYLLKIASDATGSVKGQVMLASAIQYKNLIKDFWPNKQIGEEEDDDDKPPYALNDADKNFVRANHVPVMCQCRTKPIFRQFEDSLYMIAAKEYPEGWQMLVTQIKDLLVSSGADQARLCAALYAFNCLARVFKYKNRDDALLKLLPYMEKIYDLLYELGLKLVNNQSDMSANMLKLIFKPYYDAVSMCSCPGLLKEELLSKWLAMLQQAYSWPLPAEAETPTDDPEEIKARGKLPLWKLKTVVCDVFYKLFQHYGVPIGPNDNEKEAKSLIQTKYMVPLFEMHLGLLRLSKTKFIAPKMLTEIYRFMGLAVKCFLTTNLIRPLLPEILNEIAFPRLLMTAQSAAVWEADQIEFLQTVFEDEVFEIDPRSAAITFILCACKHREYDESKGKKRVSQPVLNDFLRFLGQVLQESVQKAQPQFFEASLYALGKLQDAIKKYPAVLAQIELVLNSYVSPGLESPIGIVRLRCCWVYSIYAEMGFSDRAGLGVACDRLVKCLQDPCLAVKVVAAIAICSLAEMGFVKAKLKSSVPAILSHMLALMGQVEYNDLVESLEKLVKIFDAEIRPFSARLILELLSAFTRMSKHICEEDKKEAEDMLFSEGEMAAAACVSTISKVINVIGPDQALLDLVEKSLLVLVRITFTPEQMYVIEDGLEVLGQLTFYSNPISPDLWALYPILIEMSVGSVEEEKKKSIKKNGSWGFENVRDIGLCVQNFVTKAPDVILAGNCAQGLYIDMLIHFIDRVVEVAKNHSSGFESIAAIRIIIAMLETMKVCIHVSIPLHRAR